MHWRLVKHETYNAAMNMAIDESICYSLLSNKSLPTMRFYKWKNSSVSIASYQNQNEINLKLCRKNNVDVVRRITGGRAVYHDKRDFTYSVVAPIRIFDNSINKAYREICSWIINALKNLGIRSTLQNKNDIMVDGRKISGNAAKLINNKIYLQHGTLVYDIDFDIMPKILNISKFLAKEKIASVLEFKNVSQDKVYEALKNNFMEDKHVKIKNLTKDEINSAKQLTKIKYSSIKLLKNVLLKNKGVCYVESGI